MLSDIVLYTILVSGLFMGILINYKRLANNKFKKSLNLLITISIFDLIFFMALTASSYISEFISNMQGLSLIYSIALYSVLPGIFGVLISRLMNGGRSGKKN
ncbi:MAG: hypothetical protein ACP5I6_05125 [Caldisphaera sp.]|jgi:TRAP-type C4-dicarboxylate transport system permease small subunit|nr:MAG: hypothetical protein C0201_04065 [Caldisphaera sp.]PMP92075.1 MAG: hypothetical protein C0171_01485 [Caldisphaera sp.]